MGGAGPDGALTIVVGNANNQMMSVFTHRGDGLFLDRAAPSRIGIPSLRTLTFGLFLFDGDLDGDLDLFAANGHIQPDIEQVRDNAAYRQPPHLFVNDGAGGFVDAAPQRGGVFARELVGRGAAYADYDRDGDLDILVMENGGPVHLWQNRLVEQRADAHYLRVHLTGRASNRSGVGAVVTAVVGGRRQERRVQSGAGYLSVSEKALTFGLGSATAVDSLIVVWPSGTVDRLGGIAADQAVRVTEGSGAFTPLVREGRGPAEQEAS